MMAKKKKRDALPDFVSEIKSWYVWRQLTEDQQKTIEKILMRDGIRRIRGSYEKRTDALWLVFGAYCTACGVFDGAKIRI